MNNQDAWWSDVNEENNIDEVFITFDLGTNHQLSGMHVWNLNHGSAGGRSTQSGVEGPERRVLHGRNDLLRQRIAHPHRGAQRRGDYTGETVSFDNAVSARYVRFDVQTTFENDGSITKDDTSTVEASNRAGLSEVRFLAIPEPASVALVGLGGMMLLLRRRA